MKLKDLLSTLRTIQFNTVEIRDENNLILFTAPATSPALEPYLEHEVLEWFPSNINKDINFTVSLITEPKRDYFDNLRELGCSVCEWFDEETKKCDSPSFEPCEYKNMKGATE